MSEFIDTLCLPVFSCHGWLQCVFVSYGVFRVYQFCGVFFPKKDVFEYLQCLLTMSAGLDAPEL